MITLKEYNRLKDLERKAFLGGLIIENGHFNKPIDLFLTKEEYKEWCNLKWKKFEKYGLPLELRELD